MGGGERPSGLASYWKLAIALAVSLALMFVLSMSMVRSLDHFYLNLLVVMWGMFRRKRLNFVLLAAFATLFVGRARAWA